MQPKKSLLAVFGVTRHVERVRPLTDLSPCENCSYRTCQFRRAPYRRARQPANPELAVLAGANDDAADAEAVADRATLDPSASCTVNRKALTRWRDERLSMRRAEDGSVEALFRYEGTTCTNMGRALRFQCESRSVRRARAIRFASCTAPQPWTMTDIRTCAAT